MQIHDPYTLQCYDFISKIFTHTADLTVQSLGENDPETVFSCFYDLTGTGNRIKDRHSTAHPTDKFFCHRFIHSYLIFLLMIISCFHDTVYKVSLIGKKKQAFGILIQPSYGIYPHRIVQIFCHGHLITLLFCTADNPSWFIKKKQDLFFLFFDRLSINADLFIRKDLHPCGNRRSAHSNPACFCQSVRLSSGADSYIT